MIVGVQAIPACFDVEQHPVSCPREAIEAHVQAYDPLLQHPVRTDAAGFKVVDTSLVEPALADRFDVSRDGRTFSVQLRRGVTSRHGNELTAHDVKWSWERTFALDSRGARAARLAGIASPQAVRVVQTYTVQFRLEAPASDFAALMASPLPAIYDLEAVRAHCPPDDPWGKGWLRTHAAGFGPYALSSVVPGEEAVFVANDRYWRTVLPLKRVMMRQIPESSARARALRAGTIDLAADLASAEAEELKGAAGVRVLSVPARMQIALRLDPAFAPFDQPRVREALTLAIPYEEIDREVLQSRPAERRVQRQDLQAARQLLRDAGYGAGFRVTLFLSQGQPDLELVARLLQLACMRLELKMIVEKISQRELAARKAARQLPLLLEETCFLNEHFTPEDLEPLPQVARVVIGEPGFRLAARVGLEGFVRHADGRARYADFKKG